MNEPQIPRPGGWALDWRALEPEQRAAWWRQLWQDAITLRDRYRLTLRAQWWRDSIQVEALAALAAWATAYDTGAWTDPAGKLQLLYDLDRIRSLLKPGRDIFDPEREQAGFIAMWS